MNKLSEEIAVLAVIDPDAYTAGTVTSDYVDMTKHPKVMAIVMAGTLGTTAGIDAAIYEATDSSGTGAQAISGKSITALTAVGTDSDKQAIINVREDELDVADDYTHVALVMTVTTATSDAGAIIVGAANWKPANNDDLASVDEIV